MKRLKVFVVSFVLFLIIFIIIDDAVLVLLRMQENGVLSVQYSTYGVLKKDIATSGEIVPTQFSPIRISEKEYYIKSNRTYYYPDAWNKPGRILLKRRCGNFYYLTFGDGTIATVTYWSSYTVDDPNVRPDLLGPTTASKYMFGNFWFIPLGGITIAITLFLMKREKP